MNPRNLFAAAMTALALAFASGCAVETTTPEIVVPDAPTPSPEPTHKKTSTAEITTTAHDEATLLRLAVVCSRSPETNYTIIFRGTHAWDASDHERVSSILGTLKNVKLVFQD